MKTKTVFRQLYDFPGFRARAGFLSGVYQDPRARVASLVRRQKKRSAASADVPRVVSMTIGGIGCAIWTPAGIASTWSSNIDGWIAGDATP